MDVRPDPTPQIRTGESADDEEAATGDGAETAGVEDPVDNDPAVNIPTALNDDSAGGDAPDTSAYHVLPTCYRLNAI
jgi:hypothetical protein